MNKIVDDKEKEKYNPGDMRIIIIKKNPTIKRGFQMLSLCPTHAPTITVSFLFLCLHVELHRCGQPCFGISVQERAPNSALSTTGC